MVGRHIIIGEQVQNHWWTGTELSVGNCITIGRQWLIDV